MTDQAHSTLPREAKGPLAPPPALKGDLQAVAEAVGAWPEVTATTHWHFADQSRVDGVDFYVGAEELGHLHLDGSIHLATTPALHGGAGGGRVGNAFPLRPRLDAGRRHPPGRRRGRRALPAQLRPAPPRLEFRRLTADHGETRRRLYGAGGSPDPHGAGA